MVKSDLKSTFNSAAYLYEEMRPGYPAELIQDIVDLSEIPDRGSILEIGCGKGISNLINTRYEGTITKHYEAVFDFRKKIS